MGSYIKEDHFYLLGRRVAQEAIKKLGPDYNGQLLILTNAGIVKGGEHDSSLALEALKQIAACSLERKSLIVINSAIDQPLYFFFFHKNTGDSFFAQTAAYQVASIPVGEILSRDLSQLFRHLIFRNISLGRLISEAEEIELISTQQPYGRKWASLVTFAHFWAKDPPPETIRLAQFHDHICPGVLSGYYIAPFLGHKFPWREKERYFFSPPPYGKDDALQIIFNQTVGKKGMAAMLLAVGDRALLLPEAREAARLPNKWPPASFLNSLQQVLFLIDLQEE